MTALPITLDQHATDILASEHWDNHDPYGSLMHLWFPLASYVEHDRSEILPDYKPGMSSSREKGDSEYDYLWERLTDEQLRKVHDDFSKLYDHYHETGQAY